MKDDKPLVLAVYGSPRRGGNTDILLDRMIDGVLTHDVEVEKVYLSELNITPCRECHGCDESGYCVLKDDMRELYPKLMTADYVILASPIFFYSVTGWTKAFIDRAQAKWVEKYRLKKSTRGTKTRPGFFILAGGTRGPKLFQGAELTIKYFFDAIDVRVAGKLEFRKIDDKGEILNHPEALEQAYRAGVEFIHSDD